MCASFVVLRGYNKYINYVLFSRDEHKCVDTTYMLNLSLLTVNEKQQDMGIKSFLFVVSIILSAAAAVVSLFF